MCPIFNYTSPQTNGQHKSKSLLTKDERVSKTDLIANLRRLAFYLNLTKVGDNMRSKTPILPVFGRVRRLTERFSIVVIEKKLSASSTRLLSSLMCHAGTYYMSRVMGKSVYGVSENKLG